MPGYEWLMVHEVSVEDVRYYGAEQDICFNKTTIDAYKKYIKEHNLSWND